MLAALAHGRRALPRVGARWRSTLSVSELQRLLTERGIDFRDCVEKDQLMERLQESLQSGPGAHGSRLSDAERSLTSLFERCAPSVAFIQSSRFVQQSPFSPQPMEVPRGTGSGFLWDQEGHVVTNFHVIQGAQRAKVILGNSTKALDAKLVGVEEDKDIAVLKVDTAGALGVQPLAIGCSANLHVGQTAVAIGNPFGLDGTLTTGVVSAVGREVRGVTGRPIKNCVQTDAAINPGNSGGPLLDSLGQVIGVNTMIYSPSGASAGIGFAIPIDTVRRIVQQIIRHGRVLRPTLGITVADERMTRVLSQQIGRQLAGVVIMEVPRGTPAHAAGLNGCERRGDGSLVLGDLIVEAGGTPVRAVEDLLSVVEETPLGAPVALKLWRRCDDTKVESVKVTTVDRETLSPAERQQR